MTAVPLGLAKDPVAMDDEKMISIKLIPNKRRRYVEFSFRSDRSSIVMMATDPIIDRDAVDIDVTVNRIILAFVTIFSNFLFVCRTLNFFFFVEVVVLSGAL